MANLNKKILLVIGHPKSDSFCHALADSFIHGAKENNNEIKQIFSNDLIENLIRTKRQELNEFKKIESSKHWKYYVAAI